MLVRSAASHGDMAVELLARNAALVAVMAGALLTVAMLYRHNTSRPNLVAILQSTLQDAQVLYEK